MSHLAHGGSRSLTRLPAVTPLGCDQGGLSLSFLHCSAKPLPKVKDTRRVNKGILVYFSKPAVSVLWGMPHSSCTYAGTNVPGPRASEPCRHQLTLNLLEGRTS